MGERLSVEHQGPTFDGVLAAVDRISGLAHRTPTVTCAAIDDLAGRHVVLKCEQLQKVGAFKFRGATNALRAMDPEQLARELDQLALRLDGEVPATDRVYLQDQLGLLAARCQWVPDGQQRDFLQKKVDHLWTRCGNHE